MKCLLTNGKGDLTLSEIEEPRIQPGHLILKTGYASICGTDFSIINGEGPPWTSYPVVLGHEFSGTIEEIGKDVDKRNYIVSNDRINKTGFSCIYNLDYGINELLKGYELMFKREVMRQ